jgi:hypothetical protein
MTSRVVPRIVRSPVISISPFEAARALFETKVICGCASASKKSGLRRSVSRLLSRVLMDATSMVASMRVASGLAGS